MVEALVKRLNALDDRLARLETQEAGAGAGTSLNVAGALVRRGSAGEIAVGSIVVGGRYLHGYPFSRVLTFANSWADASLHATDHYVAYHQDATGKVFLTGAISGGVNTNTAFTLPVGLRPSAMEVFCIATSGGLGRVDVDASGNVIPKVGSGTYYLDGISFYPAAYDSLFTAVSFVSLWVDYGSGGYMTCGYYKDPLGRVHTRGLMKSGSIGATAFNLPAGNRVWRSSTMAALSNNAFGRLDYNSNGNIVPAVGNNAYFSVSGLMFPASDTAPEETWIPLDQQSFWVDYDGTTRPIASVWVDATGRVFMNGWVKSGTINGTAHFLPPGVRPARKLTFAAASNDAYGRASVQPASAVIPEVGSNVWFSYGGVHFLPIN